MANRWTRWTLWAVSAVAAGVALRHAALRWSDFEGYVTCGQAALSGRYGEEYGGPVPYWVWPPFFAYACICLSWLGGIEGPLPRLVWALFNIALGAFSFRTWLRAIVPAEVRKDVAPVVLVASLSFFAATVSFHQFNLVILALLIVGVDRVQRGRPVSGGVLVGLSAALKVWPALLLPYLFLRRERKATVCAAIVGVASLLAPAALFGPRRAWELTLFWLRYGGFGAGGTHDFRNQALGGVVSRVFADPNWIQPGMPALFLGGLEPSQAIRLGAVLGACLFVGLTVLLWRQPGASLLGDLAVLAPAAQLLVSPVMWSHYLVNLWGALALLVTAYRKQRPPRWIHGLAGAFLVLMILQEPALTGPRVSAMALAYNSDFLMVVALLIAAEWARRTEAARTSAVAATKAADPALAHP